MARPRGRTRELEAQTEQMSDDQLFCYGMSVFHPFGWPKTRWIDRKTGDPVARYECQCGMQRITRYPRASDPKHRYFPPEGYGMQGLGRPDKKDRRVIRGQAVDRILAGVPEVDPDEPMAEPVPITNARSKRRKTAAPNTRSGRAAANG